MRRKTEKTQQHALHNSRPITLDIIDLSRGGAGFGRDDKGRAIFVPFTMPGDTVKVKLTKAKSKFAEGHVVEIITPSPERINAPCEVFTKCGGCQWQHIPYAQQWETKKQGVFNSLSLNKIELPTDNHMDEFPATQQWHYRNRVQLRGFKNDIGFYGNQSSKLIPIDACEIAHEHINNAITDIKQQGEASKKPYKVELNLALDGTVASTWDDEHASTGFRQVNDEQNEKLKTWIADLVPDNQPIFDLFGGAGNLSLPIADRVPEVHSVDLSVPSNSSSKNKEIPPHFHFHRSSVAQWLETQAIANKLKKKGPWTALIDPPRDGLSKDGEAIAKHLKYLNVDTIIIVGCKTDPWSRDISHLLAQGWQLEKVAVFDFFPQTYHVESAAVLTKKVNSKAKNKK